MLPTPSTSHVNFDRIYEPAEDSFLLLDTLSSETESTFLQKHFPADTPSPLVVEVGTGSGVVLAFVTAHAEHILGRNDALTLGVDVNQFACKATIETVRQASLAAKGDEKQPAHFLECLNGDLATSLAPGSIDMLIFNPPYVPTEELPGLDRLNRQTDGSSDALFERDSHLLALSYAGGSDGMEITNRLLEQLPRILSDRGIAYVLVCAQNKPQEIMSRIPGWEGGWSSEIVGSSGKQAGWEKLSILRILRQHSTAVG